MVGILFQSWERFLYYAQHKEKIEPETGWSHVTCQFHTDYLKAGEWKGFQKILPAADYEAFTRNRSTIEVRSFHMQEGTARMIFRAAGAEDREGRYQCLGYGIVEERAATDDIGHFVSMAEERNKAKISYCIGTERDYWDNYPVLQMELPEQILNYLATQVEILDSNYGAERDVQGGMGGFCAVIPKKDESAKEAYKEILKEHYIQESMYEYLETVTAGGTEWVEALYLTNNDYGIVMVYQKGAEG